MEDLVKDGVTKGTPELWDYLYPDLKGQCPAGIGSMLWAHYSAPKAALKGDGEGAVKAVTAGVGAMSGAVVGSIGGPAGTALGSLVGKVIGDAPGAIVQYMDTTDVQFSVVVSNMTGHTLKFVHSDCVNYYSTTSIMVFNVDKGEQIGNNQMHRATIPAAKVITDVEKLAICAIPIQIHSKFASASFQLKAVDSDGNTVKTYDIAFQYPGDWSQYKHYVGVWENTGWDATDLTACETMGHQYETGKGNRPEQGTSELSVGYWENWETCYFELA